MVEFNPINFIRTTKTNVSNQNVQAQPQQPAKAAQAPAETNFDIDMSAADVQAAMNKALGFVRTTGAQSVNYAAVDQAAMQDPVAFVKKHAPKGAYESVDAALTSQLPALDGQEYAMVENRAESELAKLGADKFADKYTTPERRAEIEAGFAQRNPNAFTGEFLDLFAA